ncbi:hypothetical protein FRC12_000572 [Ceratobasidium sp. 428]|nr:hypothetical protein FRC12_000572 [Ceratobasidium sp. 428]
MDGHEGPIKTICQAAIYEADDANYPESWVKDERSLTAEVVRTGCDRDSNYVHAGWSLSAIANPSPWISLRTPDQKLNSSAGPWITKRRILKRFIINIPPEELRPSPEFEGDIQSALSEQNTAQKLQAVCKAFKRWGGVIPLVYELGASLTITDVENHKEQDYRWLEIPRVSDQGRCAILGGKLEVINDHGDINSWKSQELPAHERRMVRVLRAMSTIDLLKHELKEQLAALCTSILTFDPPGLDGRSDIHSTWDDTPFALKTMSRVIARCGTHVHGVSAEYADGSKSNGHGQGNNPHVFSLSCDEYISDVVVCENQWDTHAIQFVTTRGRFSPFYGGNYGGLKILSCDDGVLAGFTGRMTKSGKVDIVARIQVAWLPFGAVASLERLTLQKGGLYISEEMMGCHSATGLLIQPLTQHTSHALTFNAEM